MALPVRRPRCAYAVIRRRRLLRRACRLVLDPTLLAALAALALLIATR